VQKNRKRERNRERVGVKQRRKRERERERERSKAEERKRKMNDLCPRVTDRLTTLSLDLVQTQRKTDAPFFLSPSMTSEGSMSV
jgi:hypothetical protein